MLEALVAEGFHRLGIAMSAAADSDGRGFREILNDVAIAYVGHAARWDEVVVRGEPDKRDCLVAFKQDKKVRAVATIFTDDVQA